MVVALPAQAHTVEELEEWETDWNMRVANRGFSVGLAHEFTEMVGGHMWYFHPPDEVSSVVVRSSDPVDRSLGSNVEQWRDLVAAYFPASEVNRALCIMSHESGGNPGAKNPRSSARGLMQILASLWAPHFGVTYEDLYNPEINMRVARGVWDQQGWWGWSPYRRGLCR